MFYCLKIQYQQTKFSFLSPNVSFAAVYRHNSLCVNTKNGWHFPAIYKEGTSRCTNISKRIRDATVSVSAMLVDTHQKNIAQVLFLSDIFLFPFVRQQVTVLA